MVVVSHGHVLRVLIVGWLGLAVTEAGGLVVDPASISVLGHRHGRPVVVALNDRAHLSADRVERAGAVAGSEGAAHPAVGSALARRVGRCHRGATRRR